jgi:hypothetical protein
MPGFLSPQPKAFAGQPLSINWPERYSQDITTGAPQKLFRYLQDSVSKFGFYTINAREPQIVGQAIGDTGTTEGHVLCERGITEVGNGVVRVLGLALLLIGVFAMLGGLTNFYLLLTGLVLVVVGVILMRMHAFHSELLFIHIKGEAYRSGLSAGTRMPAEVAESQRLSVISELRLSLYGAEVESRNSGAWREYVRSLSSPNMSTQFQVLLNDLSTSILPKVLIQKSWEQTRHEYSTPMVIREVKHEVLVKCGYCGNISPSDAAQCRSCGGNLR